MTLHGEALARRLGYPSPRSGRVRRAVQEVAATRAVAAVLARSVRPVDELLRRAGRSVTVPSLVAGLPAVVLVTTGARSGRPRAVPLIPVVTADTFAVLGTNFGGARTPAWALNLLASPAATLEYGGRSLPVRARPLEGREREALLAASARVYVGFPRYVARARHRTVHVFALEAPPEASPADLPA